MLTLYKIVSSGFSGVNWSPEIRETSNEADLIRRLQTIDYLLKLNLDKEILNPKKSGGGDLKIKVIKNHHIPQNVDLQNCSEYFQICMSIQKNYCSYN